MVDAKWGMRDREHQSIFHLLITLYQRTLKWINEYENPNLHHFVDVHIAILIIKVKVGYNTFSFLGFLLWLRSNCYCLVYFARRSECPGVGKSGLSDSASNLPKQTRATIATVEPIVLDENPPTFSIV